MWIRPGDSFVSIDAESNGLHGPAFAVAAVRFRYLGPDDSRGALVEGAFAARVPMPSGEAPDVHPFVRAHVLPAMRGMPVTYGTARALRLAWWAWWERQGCPPVVADCPWPVEANFLTACIDDAPDVREMRGPYPVLDVATLVGAAHGDAMISRRAYVGLMDAGHAGAHPDDAEHDPRWDALLSGYAAVRALLALAGSSRCPRIDERIATLFRVPQAG